MLELLNAHGLTSYAVALACSGKLQQLEYLILSVDDSCVPSRRKDWDALVATLYIMGE